MQELQKQELSRELIKQINEIQMQIGYIKIQDKKDDYSFNSEAAIEELEKKQLEISGFESIEKMHKAIGRFYHGELELDSDWGIRYSQLRRGLLKEEEMKPLLGNHAHALVQRLGWLADGGDWLEQMYYMRLLIEILEDRPYGQGLFKHVPEEKDEKLSDESKEVAVGGYHVWNGAKKDVNYHINIDSGIYLFEIMKILEDHGFVVHVVDPLSVKSASYFSEDFQSVREVSRKGYLGLRVDVRKYSNYHKEPEIELHI